MNLFVLAISLALSSLASAQVTRRLPNINNGSGILRACTSFMSPWQEGGEEADTPRAVPQTFQSVPPKYSRAERVAMGHKGVSVAEFSNDLSQVNITVQIAGIKTPEINLFHIHCGRPGVLGPIIVDFSLFGNVSTFWRPVSGGGNLFTMVITNTHITNTSASGAAFTAQFGLPNPTLGCPIEGLSLSTPVLYSTVAGLYSLALNGQIYFNLHTIHNTYYGDIRGQWQC